MSKTLEIECTVPVGGNGGITGRGSLFQFCLAYSNRLQEVTSP